MNKNVLRQWALLRLLPRYPKKTSVAELIRGLEHTGFDVTVRTLQRDLNALALSFPIVSDESKPQGWSWSRDAPQLNFPEHDQQTAVNLVVARMHLEKILPKNSINYLKPWFNAADTALNTFGGFAEKINHKIRVVNRSYKLIPPEFDQEIIEKIYNSLIKETCLKIKYLSRSKNREDEYLIHPVAVVIVDAVSYLLVTFDGHEDVRHLAVHRISSVIEIPEKRKLPEIFELDEYITQGHFGFIRNNSFISLKFRLKTNWASHLYETPFVENQLITDLGNGWTSVEGNVRDTAQIRWWLRGFGPDLIVERPDGLVEEFRQEAIEAAKNYLK